MFNLWCLVWCVVFVEGYCWTLLWLMFDFAEVMVGIFLLFGCLLTWLFIVGNLLGLVICFNAGGLWWLLCLWFDCLCYFAWWTFNVVLVVLLWCLVIRLLFSNDLFTYVYCLYYGCCLFWLWVCGCNCLIVLWQGVFGYLILGLLLDLNFVYEWLIVLMTSVYFWLVLFVYLLLITSFVLFGGLNCGIDCLLLDLIDVNIVVWFVWFVWLLLIDCVTCRFGGCDWLVCFGG